MEKYTGRTKLTSEAPLSSLVRFFPESLWRGSTKINRTKDWESLYVDAYSGPREPSTLSRHDFWELSVVLKGDGTFMTHETIMAYPSLCILVPPEIPHQEVSHDKTFQTVWIGFRTNMFKETPTECLYLAHTGLADMAQDLWLFSKEQGKAIGQEIDARVAQIVLRFFRLRDEAESQQGADRVSRAIAWLEAHFREEISVSRLAQELNCSEGYLHRCFHKRTGDTPGAYLQNLRINQARFLLQNTRLSVQEVGERVGYPSPSYFSRIFKKVTGLSPSTFQLNQTTIQE